MNEKDFESTMNTIILENGKSIYQTGRFYTKTGLRSDGYAFGNMENMAEYSINNEDGEVTKYYSTYLSSNVSGLPFPNGIKYGDSFKSSLEKLGLLDEYENAAANAVEYEKPDFNVANIAVYFHGWHSEATNSTLEAANVTINYNETSEKNLSGKTHTYTRSMSLHFSEGKLVYFDFSLRDKYNSAGEPANNNDRVGIKFTNPEYKTQEGYGFQIRSEEIYHKDQKIYVTYSVKSEKQTELTVHYTGAYSADNLAGFAPLTHTVKGEQRFTDIIEYSGGASWKDDLNTVFLTFWSITAPSVNFIYGDISLVRPSDSI